MKYQTDIVILNKINTKWDTRNISKIEQQIREIDREASIIIADSNEWDTTPSDYLPGGLLNIFLSKSSPLVNMNHIVKGRLGN